jgi:hypothetical protein
MPNWHAASRKSQAKAIEKIVGIWPGAWETARGEKLGLTGDTNFAGVIRAFIEGSKF